jgi:hypothetical protein
VNGTRLVAAALWQNRHQIGTVPARTRAPLAGSVDREGGGIEHPTLGGGCWVMARMGASPRDRGL